MNIGGMYLLYFYKDIDVLQVGCVIVCVVGDGVNDFIVFIFLCECLCMFCYLFVSVLDDMVDFVDVILKIVVVCIFFCLLEQFDCIQQVFYCFFFGNIFIVVKCVCFYIVVMCY